MDIGIFNCRRTNFRRFFRGLTGAFFQTISLSANNRNESSPHTGFEFY